MARGINKVILIGNCGQDPEVKYMPSGDALANVTLATSDSWKDKATGQQQERTEWHRVVFFKRLAEIVGEYVRKGSKLYIEGRLQTRSWEQDGVKRYATEIIANEMQMLDSRGAAPGGYDGPPMQQQYQQSNQQQSQQSNQGQPPQQNFQRQQNQPPQSQPTTQNNNAAQLDDFDDDIPF